MDVNAEVRSPDLFLALASWTERALPFLQSRIEQRPLETRDALIWAPRLVSEAFNPKSQIRMLPETRELGAVVAGMPQFSEDDVSNEDWHSNPLLPPIQASLKFGYFLYAYLGDELDWSFNRRRFAAVYHDLVLLLEDPGAISISVLVELWNVILPSHKIELANDVVIRALTTVEQERHIAASRSTERFGSAELFDHYDADPPAPDLYLELKRTGRAYATEGLSLAYTVRFGVTDDVRRAAHDTLLGLRLLSEGDFGIGPYTVVTNNRLLRVDGLTAFSIARDWPASRSSMPEFGWQRPRRRETLNTAWGSYTDRSPDGPPIVITASIEDALQRLWPVLQLSIQEELEPAFHRFELSYERADPEDRIIDYWVALESLFLRKGDGGLKRTASNRLAHFIEPNPELREAINESTKHAYKLRSDVVHANVYDPAEVECSADKIAAFLRRALLRCLELNAPPDRKALDRATTGEP